MASLDELVVVESCQISPPLQSVPPTTLPLTFFDIPWLLFSPTQPLFFFDFPHSTVQFTETTLPNLKQSLSLTLHHFFPFAGTIETPPEPAKPRLNYAEGHSVSLTVAESNSDFHYLCGHHQRVAGKFHHLVPHLLEDAESTTSPVLAVQITLFPDQSGVCMGFALRHVVSDGRTFNNFLKTWAFFSKTGPSATLHSPLLNKLPPCHGRSVIQDTGGVEPILLREWWNQRNLKKEVEKNISTELVRATFVMSRPEMEKIKAWILTRSNALFGSTPLLLSPYVVTCAYIWMCLIRTHWSEIEDPHQSVQERPLFFGFIAGGITRLDFPVPTNYVGNCVAFGRSMATTRDLLGENGVLFAAKSIGDTVKKLDKKVLEGAGNWISDWKEMLESEAHLTVTGSPKVDLYDLDFGWGRPKKLGDIGIDRSGAISLCESREMVGGIEIGLSRPRSTMDTFGSLFIQGLKAINL